MNNNSIPYKTYEDLYKVILKHISILPKDIDLIVGIPRSGMIPAYMIGLLMNKSVSTYSEYINGIENIHGERKIKVNNNQNRKILFVDDSIHSGVQLGKIKAQLEESDKEERLFLAIYARDKAKDLVDFWFEIVDVPRVFQWNYLYHGCVENSCFDIDGVLCEDPLPEENDDGEKYLDFINNAKPLFIPNECIHMLVTSRLEKYRIPTERWLKANGVKYKKLVMLDLPSKEERIRQNAHSNFKAEIYKNDSTALFFYESERKQAIEIAAKTHKPVFCVETGELFNGSEDEINKYLINSKKGISFLNGKRILFYTQELTYTGSPHSLLRMAKALKAEGAYVEVWSKVDGNFRVEFEKEHICVSIYDTPFLSTGKCARLISEYDLAISNTVLTEKFYLAAKDIVPTIWYIREAQNLPQICIGNIERESALKNAERIYCVSEYAADFIKKKYNSSVKVVKNCVEDYYQTGEVNEVKDQINIMAMGTINYRKAFDVFIDAFFELSEEEQKKVHLYFAGRLLDEISDYWKPLMDKIVGNKHITFLGEISNTKEKIDVMKNMNVFCIVSRDESCSLVTLEAAMLGKAIIVSENVGAKYIVSQDNGWIVKTGDVQDLARIFKEIIANPQKLKQMGEKSRQAYLSSSTIKIYNKNIVNMVIDCLRELEFNYERQQNEILIRTENQLKKTQLMLKDERNKNINNTCDNNEIVRLQEEVERLNYCLSEIRKSISFKIGRTFTWLFRYLRHIFTGASR